MNKFLKRFRIFKKEGREDRNEEKIRPSKSIFSIVIFKNILIIKIMDESAKIRMNLVAIQKVDPYAKEILDSCPHVAYYKYSEREWLKSEIEGN